VETDEFEDVGAGIYPTYHVPHDGRIRVATSAAALIADLGDLRKCRGFEPPDFLGEYFPGEAAAAHAARAAAESGESGERDQGAFVWDMTTRWGRGRGRRRIRGDEPRAPRRPTPWYGSTLTLDARVLKTAPFLKLSAPREFKPVPFLPPFGGRRSRGPMAEMTFTPNGTLRDVREIVERSARHVAAFVQDVERRFPGHQHVVLTGGKDSQLIWLVPKADPSRWHAFSAEPNRPIVAAWMQRNGVRPARVFGHDGRADETPADLERKIVASDLYSDPAHIRWMPAMVRIREELGGRCIFWGGTMSGPAHFFSGAHRRFDGADRDAFFGSHFQRTASWQGNYHQVFRNVVGSPYLSPYHSREIWDDVFRHVDPSVVTKDMDLRDAIGERLPR
jgi:hypothetical protein